MKSSRTSRCRSRPKTRCSRASGSNTSRPSSPSSAKTPSSCKSNRRKQRRVLSLYCGAAIYDPRFLQGGPCGRGLSLVDNFVNSSVGLWADTVSCPAAQWEDRISNFIVNKRYSTTARATLYNTTLPFSNFERRSLREENYY